jgi:hypothetical protein
VRFFAKVEQENCKQETWMRFGFEFTFTKKNLETQHPTCGFTAHLCIMKQRLAFVLSLVMMSLGCTYTRKEIAPSRFPSVLAGNWLQVKNGVRTIERWRKASDSLFIGISCDIKNNDTLFEETMRVFPRKGKWILEVRLNGASETVEFAEDQAAERFMVFANPKNKYPQKIGYRQDNPETLSAMLTGVEKGHFRKELVTYSRQEE